MKMNRPRAGLLVSREHRETEGDVEKISGAGGENTRTELGPSMKLVADRKHWRSLENK